MGGAFHQYMQRQRGRTVLQPRMGFSDVAEMRRGLQALKALPFPRVGTLTLDSFTRMGRFAEARAALAAGHTLNGYPLGALTLEENRALLHGVCDGDFPVQARHGSPLPLALFQMLTAIGIDATEGGPVSYCLPYGRIPLADSVAEWRDAVQVFAREGGAVRPHLESFGGCMMGQLGHPDLLVALAVLECMFFAHHGMTSVSAGFAQGTHRFQDLGALQALHLLLARYVPEAESHVVLYTFMGMFPATPGGARALIAHSAVLAHRAGCARLVLKTVAEAHRIPHIEDNLEALHHAHQAAAADGADAADMADGEAVVAYAEAVTRGADRLIQAVAGLAEEPGEALLRAFRRGLLDVPYCLHPDNAGLARTGLDDRGAVVWRDSGRMPLKPCVPAVPVPETAESLLAELSFLQRSYDAAHGGAVPA